MEMGVNIGQPPGSGPPTSYQPAASQPYYSNHGNEPCYQNQAHQQQHTMFRGQTTPQILSPNQGLPFHNKGVRGYPANQPQGMAMPAAPGQFSGLAKKGGYVSDCVAYNGPQNVLYSPNGLTRVQGAPQPGKFGPRPVNHQPVSNQTGNHAPGQFQGRMMFPAGQGGPPPHQVMWFQNNSAPGLNSPPGGLHVRFPGNRGNLAAPRMALMSPPGVGGPRGQGQMVRHMVMSPGAGQDVVMSCQGSPHMAGQHGSVQHPGMPTVQQYVLPEQGQPREVAQQQQQQQAFQHYQQQVHRHLMPQSSGQLPGAAPGAQYSQPTVCTQFTQQPALSQNSPSIPYSQALQGYTSPEPAISHQPCSRPVRADNVPVPCQLAETVSSVQGGGSVYTMANSQAAYTITASPQTIMSGSTQVVLTPCHSDRINAHGHDHLNSSQSIEGLQFASSVSTGASPNSQSELSNTHCKLTANVEVGKPGNNTTTCDAKCNVTSGSDQDYSTSEWTESQGVVPDAKSAGRKAREDTLVASQSCRPSVLTVPFGWRRVAEKGTIIYYSPTQKRLSSLKAVVDYLTSDGTCKCGLSCPLRLETTFNFDLGVPARPWTVDCEAATGDTDLKRLCNHKRKLIAMATLQTSGSLNTFGQFGEMHQTASKVLEALSQGKKEPGKRKKKSKLGDSPREAAMLSNLPSDHNAALHGLTHGSGPQPRFLGHVGPMAHHPYLHESELKVATSLGQCDPIKVETCDLGTTGMEAMPPDVAKHPLQQQMMMGEHHPSDPRFRFGGPMHRPPHQHFQQMHRHQNPFEMLMGARQKMAHGPDQMPEGHVTPGHRRSPMNFGAHSGCMPPANQMFSLQLQMQAQAAAARNAGGARFGMTSPNLSSPSQHGSPSPGQFHINKAADLRSPPPFYDHSSPSPTLGPYRTPSRTPQTPGPHILSPSSLGQPGKELQQTSTGTEGPPPLKKKKKKKKKKDMNRALAGVLDKNMPCPNVDVRQFSQKHFLPHMAMGGPFQGGQVPMQSPSFMENPAAFLAQQAEIMTNKIQSSLESESQYMTSQGPQHALHNRDSCMYHNAPASVALAPLEQSQGDMSCQGDRQSPLAAEDTLAGILSQDSSQSRPSSQNAMESTVPGTPPQNQEPDGTSKEFPASCLLSAAARARFAPPCCVGRTTAISGTPLNSWNNSLRMNRFKIPSGPAPIRHVPPGGQQIGGGSIVYHHNIENQQAFQEGGIVNGGGILMVSTPANQSDSLYCLQSKPLFLQDAMGHRNVPDSAQHNRLATSGGPGHASTLGAHGNQVLSSDPLHKPMMASPIQMVQNLISGIGNPGARAISHLARVSVGDLTRANTAATVSETLLTSTTEQQNAENSIQATIVNPPMPPLSVAAVTAVTNSITEAIPTVVTQVPVLCTTETSSSMHTVTSVSPEKCQTQEARHPCQNVEDPNIPRDRSKVNSNVEQAENIVNEAGASDAAAATPQLSESVQSSHAQTTGTLKVRVVLKNTKKKKKKKKSKKIKVSRYVVEQSINSEVTEVPKASERVPDNEPNPTESEEAKTEDCPEDDCLQDSEIVDTPPEDEGPVMYSEGVEATMLLEHHSRVLEQASEPLVFPQGGGFPHQILQGQDLAQVCLTTQAQDQLAIAQGQATNLIQTVSFMPNMVGIDPNTGLVQSIQMPVASSPEGGPKNVACGVTDQVSPVAHTQVVQTMVQSLHIQNNMLVQGVTPAAGTFLQPLGAVGNALIPIFPGAGAVAPSSESAMSLMAMSSAVSISNGGQISPYLESPRPSSNVVSTQTEAVQTEDSCSELLDSEGGGRLLVDNDGILADEDDLQETLELAGGDDEQEDSYESPDGFAATPEGQNEASGAFVVTPTSETMEAFHNIESSPDNDHDKDVCATTKDLDNTESLNGMESKEISNEITDSESKVQDTDMGCANKKLPIESNEPGPPNIHIDRNTSKSSVDDSHNHPKDDENKQSKQDSSSVQSGDDKLTAPFKDTSRPHSSSYLSVPMIYSDLSQSDSLSDSQSMPILSREGSAKDLASFDADRKKMIPALAVLHRHLEETVRMHKDEPEFLGSSSQDDTHQERKSSKSSAEMKMQELAREKSEDPPALSVIGHVDRAIKKRGARLKKNKRAKLRQKGKVLRASLRLNNTHIKSFPESTHANKSPLRKEISINNNKSPEVSHPEVTFPQNPAPSPTIPDVELKAQPKAPSLPETKDAYLGAPESGETREHKSGSVGGASDGEANQSSDSSQSVVSSEGDEVRHGNSPSIRCSNLLTSSPETNDLNCSGHGGFDKVPNLDGKVFTDGTKNHVRSGPVHMKTRRSIRSELENVLPRRATKRAISDNAKHNELEVGCPMKSPVDPPLPKSFRVGELIWGPIKNFPSWPGKLVPHSDVPRNPASEPDKLWVRWFGMHTHSQVEPALLKTLSEGLEAHHSACLKQRKGRKMNPNLESAIEEAMQEFDRPIVSDTAPADPSQEVIPGKVAKVKKVLKKKKTK